jgi:hypothetical protein
MRWRDRGFNLPLMIYQTKEASFSVKFHELSVYPEIEYPVGRKGLVLWSAWQQLGVKANADGMLIVDGDVAIHPGHVIAMFNAINDKPDAVHTAPVKLWPGTSGYDSWVWAHWEHEPSQEIDRVAKYFSFCFTYLPKKLLDACYKGGIINWAYPNVDASVSDWARRSNIEGYSVPGIEPVHMHW